MNVQKSDAASEQITRSAMSFAAALVQAGLAGSSSRTGKIDGGSSVFVEAGKPRVRRSAVHHAEAGLAVDAKAPRFVSLDEHDVFQRLLRGGLLRILRRGEETAQDFRLFPGRDPEGGFDPESLERVQRLVRIEPSSPVGAVPVSVAIAVEEGLHGGRADVVNDLPEVPHAGTAKGGFQIDVAVPQGLPVFRAVPAAD